MERQRNLASASSNMSTQLVSAEFGLSLGFATVLEKQQFASEATDTCKQRYRVLPIITW